MVIAFTTVANADTIHTLDGKTYDGEIRLDSGPSLHIVNKEGRNAGVKLSHLLDATFDGAVEPAMSRGVVLTDGTLLAGSIDSIGDKVIRITPTGQPTLQLPIENIARVVFQPAPPEMVAKVPAGSSGLLLKGGDFLEGQLQHYDTVSVRMESVLFGVSQFDTHDKAVALVLKPAKALDAETIVRTVHGSEFAADQLSIDHGQLRFNAAGIGPVALQRGDLAQIRTAGGRLVAMADLHPTTIEGGDPAKVYAVDRMTAGLSPRLLGTDLTHTMSISAGSRVTFALDEKYDVFTVKAGVPADALPTRQLRFAVLVDGKETASATQSSTDDPAVFGVDVHHAKTLTLVVTSTGSTISGPPGVWGDPQLVRHAAPKFAATPEPVPN